MKKAISMILLVMLLCGCSHNPETTESTAEPTVESTTESTTEAITEPATEPTAPPEESAEKKLARLKTEDGFVRFGKNRWVYNGDGQPLKSRLMGVEMALTPEQLDKTYVVLGWQKSSAGDTDEFLYQLLFFSRRLCEAYWGMQDSSLEAVLEGRTGSEIVGDDLPIPDDFLMFSIELDDWWTLERDACRVYRSYEAHGEVVEYPEDKFYTLYRNTGCDYCDDFNCVLDELDEEWAEGLTENDLWLPTADEISQILTVIERETNVGPEPTYMRGGREIPD